MSEELGKLEEKYFPFIFHYYRAEVYRETVWRNRLDVTTNWSIVVTAAILSFAFSNPEISHAVIIIDYLVVIFFLYIEARRFRYYAILRERTKLLEKDLLSPIFSNTLDSPDLSNKMGRLSSSLERPTIDMSRVESISWRLRRNYLFILPLIYIVWIYRVASIPTPAFYQETLYANASVGFLPGIVIFTAMTVSIMLILFTAFYIPQKYGRDDLP